MRIACSSAIYRKSLRMSKRAATQTSAGNVVNLLSNDVSRLDYGFIFVHYIWILPIQGESGCGLVENLLCRLSQWLDHRSYSLFLFISPTACLICYLIWREVKYAAVVGVVGLLIKTVPIQTGLSKISSILRWVKVGPIVPSSHWGHKLILKLMDWFVFLSSSLTRERIFSTFCTLRQLPRGIRGDWQPYEMFE